MQTEERAAWEDLKARIAEAEPIIKAGTEKLDKRKAQLKSMCLRNVCGNMVLRESHNSGTPYDKPETITYATCRVCRRFDEIKRE